MAVLTATIWTFAVTSRSGRNRRIIGKNREVQVRMEMQTDSGLFYPSGKTGIPLPTTPGEWGMKRNIDYIILKDTDIENGIIWKYSASQHSILGWSQGPTAGGITAFLQLPTTWKPSLATAAPVLHVIAVGW